MLIQNWQVGYGHWYRHIMVMLVMVLCTLASEVQAQYRQSITACRGDTITLQGPRGYVEYTWTPVRLGRRRGQEFDLHVRQPAYRIFLQSEPLLGPNLLRNSDFNGGFQGFESDYQWAQTGARGPGVFAVDNNSRSFDESFSDCFDITRDTTRGNMLIASAANRESVVVYRSDFVVESDSLYQVAFWASPLQNRSVEVRAYVNDQLLDAPLVLPPDDCGWQQFSALYRAGSTTTDVRFTLRIAAEPGTGLALDAVLFARKSPTRFDTFDILSTALDTVWQEPILACAGEDITFGNTSTRSDRILCQSFERAGSCDSVVCVEAQFSPIPEYELTAIDPRCAGSRDGSIALRLVQVQSGQSATLRWNPESGLSDEGAGGLGAGVYGFELLYGDNCQLQDSVVLREPAPLTWERLPAYVADCAGGTRVQEAQVNGGTAPYRFSFRQNGASLNAEELRQGPVDLLVEDANGCSSDTSYVWAGIARDGLAILGPNRVLAGSRYKYQVLGLAPGQGFDWSFGGASGSQEGKELSLLIEQSGLLRISIEAEGCRLSTQVQIEVLAPVKNRFPNAFSPNGDGVNDVFSAVEDPDLISIRSLQVFDRWGTLVFASGICPIAQAINCGWAGFSESEGRSVDAQEGCYVYLAELEWRDGRVELEQGEVCLLR